jgi:hypothetical protein
MLRGDGMFLDGGVVVGVESCGWFSIVHMEVGTNAGEDFAGANFGVLCGGVCNHLAFDGILLVSSEHEKGPCVAIHFDGIQRSV